MNAVGMLEDRESKIEDGKGPPSSICHPRSLISCLVLLVTIGCLALAKSQWAPDFHNIASQAGLVHALPNGGAESKQYILETTGSGAAFLDYDNDGLLDIFLVAGPDPKSPSAVTNRLYRNVGKARFVEVTQQAGLAKTGWGQGVCTGDVDGDGFVDLFVTYWGQSVLYRNVAGKRFEDVTAKAHLLQDRVRYNTGCAFLDYDADGDLDLFVANYLKFDFANSPKPGENSYCWYRGLPVNCGPRGLPFDRNLLYRNNGDGSFSDVSEESGVSRPLQNYALGVVTGDFNHDGRVDVYVACDTTPSLLYINQGGGKFQEEALLRGAALDDSGRALSGMGVTAGDYDGDGSLDLFRSNFSDERETLYHNRGDGEFDDATQSAGLAHNTRFVGWGCGFFDFDNDGRKDLLLVNGHAYPEVDRLGIDVRYKDRPVLYQNLGNGRFTDLSEQAGPALLERHASRGAAFGDIDNDGTVEVLVNHQNEPPSLLKLRKPAAHRWLTLKLLGSDSNSGAVGARVKLTAEGKHSWEEVRSGGSYLSQSDLRLHFGLGEARKVELIEIEWPSGCRQTLHNLPVDQILIVRENCKDRQKYRKLGL
jgi:enediyne biosynthesis protein E4